MRWDRVFSVMFLLVLAAGITYVIARIAAEYEPAPVVVAADGYQQQISAPVVSDVLDTKSPEADPEDPTAFVMAPVEEDIVGISLREDGVYPIETTLKSAYSIVFDVTAGEILFEKSADMKCFPASTTKLLTACVLLDTLPDDFVFVVGDEQDLVPLGSSLAMVQKGNELDMATMIDALMLPSGNDAAYTAAANCGRVIANDPELTSAEAVEVFMNRCNETLHAIGAADSHFSVPDGFHAEDHYTTAVDMLKIAVHAMNYPMLMESVDKTFVYATFLTGQSVEWRNSNLLIQESSEDCYYTYARGMKTGMTDEAGYCVVALATRFGHDVICVTMGAEASDIRWLETISLLDSSFVYIKNNIDAAADAVG
jgi:D-alanyl-D-alanine carboxypeptidase (penicillin-binding protein 5/6)